MLDVALKKKSLIRIVDDDTSITSGLQFLLDCADWKSVVYNDPLEFLEKDNLYVPGCLLLDIKMPKMNGLQLQKELIARNSPLPIVIITGHADVDTAVKTMKNGAVNFLQKPVIAEDLEAVLEEAVSKSQLNFVGVDTDNLVRIYRSLSGRELQISELIYKKYTNRQIAARLGLSERTVQGHRYNLSKKFNTHSPAELVLCLKSIHEHLKTFEHNWPEQAEE